MYSIDSVLHSRLVGRSPAGHLELSRHEVRDIGLLMIGSCSRGSYAVKLVLVSS